MKADSCLLPLQGIILPTYEKTREQIKLFQITSSSLAWPINQIDFFFQVLFEQSGDRVSNRLGMTISAYFNYLGNGVQLLVWERNS